MKTYLVDNQKQIVLIFLGSLAAIFFFLLLLSLVKPLYIDEGVFLAIGKGIANGKLMYRDFWDHKPPGIHFLYAGLFFIFSTKIILYKLFLWLVNFFTAALVYLISEKECKGSGKFSALFFLCALVFLEGNYLSAGPYVALSLTLSAYLIILEHKPKIVFLSGIALAIAVIFKQTAILNLFAILIFLLISKRFRDILYFGAGLIVPIGTLLVYLSNVNLFTEFKSQVFTLTYASETLSFRLVKWVETFSRVWWLWFGLVLGVFVKINKKEKLFFALMVIVPTLAFVRHYPHYWLQVLPFMAIFAGIGFSEAINRYYKKYPYIVIPVLAFIVVSFFQSMLWYYWVTKHLNEPKQKEEAQITEELKQLDYERILAENRYTGFYFLSDKEPLSKFLYRTEVNEKEDAKSLTLDRLKNENKVVALWPKDQTLVYSKEIGDWLQQNARILKFYPELDLLIYYKD